MFCYVLLKMYFSLFSGSRKPDDSGGTNASGAVVRAPRGDAIYDLSEASSLLLRLLAVCQFVVGLFYRLCEASLRTLHTAQ